MRLRIAAAAAVVLTAGWLTARAQLEEGTTVAGFRIPEYDKEGQLKSQLFGDYAKVISANKVEITNLRIEQFKKGEVDMRVAAPHCLYDRRANTATSPSQVRITRSNMVISGTGFRWEAGASRFEINSDVRVVLKGTRRHLDAEEEKP